MTFGEVEVRIGVRRSPNWSALFCLAAFGCSSPEGIQVSIETPTTVAKGGRFQIVAKVQNSAPRPQKLVSKVPTNNSQGRIPYERLCNRSR